VSGGVFAFDFNVEASVGDNDGDEVVGHSEVDQSADEAVMPNLVKSLFHTKEDCGGLFSQIEVKKDVVDDSEKLG